MPYVHLVIVLALLEFLLFGYAVGRARTPLRSEARHAGFALSAIPNVTLLVGALIGVTRAALIA